MSWLSRLFLLFVGVPLLDLFVLIQVGQWIGLWPTIGLVVVTGFAGASLARSEGLRTLWTIQKEMNQGRLPGDALFDGLAILLGGVLLLTPGILTDLVGFSFLVPATRRLLLKRIRASLERRLKSGSIRVAHFHGFAGTPGSGWGPDPHPDRGGLDRAGEIVVEPGDSDGP
jgi:UPF0716 protein FxsA